MIATLRGDVPEAEGGEDVDLTPAGRLGRPCLKLVGVLRLHDRHRSTCLGWAISGAVLFAGSAWALGSRTLVRDVLVGVVLSVGSWYALLRRPRHPAHRPGILDGVL